MPISLSCPECAKPLRVKDESAGKKIRCPSCETIILVPDPNTRPLKPKAPIVPRDEEEDEIPARKAGTKGRKPVRKAKGSKTGLIIGLSAGGLAADNPKDLLIRLTLDMLGVIAQRMLRRVSRLWWPLWGMATLHCARRRPPRSGRRV